MNNLENQFGITQEQILEAKNKVDEVMRRKNVALFKDDYSKNLFHKIATFWLCIPHITDYRVRYQDHFELNKAEYFIIDFDREEDHEEVAFAQLVFKYGNTSCSVLEIDPYQPDDSEWQDFQMVLTDKMVRDLFEDLDFIKEVNVKENLAGLFDISLEDNSTKNITPLSLV